MRRTTTNMQEEEEEGGAALPGLLSSSDREDEDDGEKKEKKRGEGRNVCWDGCGRPSSVCICPYLPAEPIPTSTTVLILHHPHELRHNRKLSTLPALSRCLLHSHLLPGRKLHPNSHPLLRNPYSTKLFLFPSPSSSVDISQWASATPLEQRASPLLIVFDGTWTHAREMVAASMGFLGGFAVQVSVGRCEEGKEGPSTYESELVMRKEPLAGCMSTMEAVARALRVLEPEGAGAAVEERLLGVLRAMVRFQARNLRPMEPRKRRTRKKKMVAETGEEEEEE